MLQTYVQISQDFAPFDQATSALDAEAEGAVQVRTVA